MLDFCHAQSRKWRGPRFPLPPCRWSSVSTVAHACGGGGMPLCAPCVQGPNYALAKRLQHWLAIIARASGHTVSSNVAPSTATLSVVHNAQFAAAYGGFHHFKPMEVRGHVSSSGDRVFYYSRGNSVFVAVCLLLCRCFTKTRPMPSWVRCC